MRTTLSTPSTVIDLGAKKKEWLREIEEFMTSNVTHSEKIMQEQQAIQMNDREINKRKQWIAFSSEIMGEAISSGPSEEIGTQKVAIESPQATYGSLPKSIIYILDSDPERSYFISELADLILKSGHRTSSPNFTNILFNALKRLVGEKKIHMFKEGNKNKYRSTKISEGNEKAGTFGLQ
jgi:hypothetical protein